MRQIIPTLLFGLAALTSTVVHAERVDAAGFAMSIPGTWSDSSLGLLSDSGGTARIAIKGFDGVEGYVMDVTSQEDYAPDLLNWGQSGFAFDVRDGYRINSMTLTGTLTGVLNPGTPPTGGTIGVVRNEFTMGWRFEQAGQSISMGQQTLDNVHGDAQVRLNAGMPFEGDFKMLLDNQFYIFAQSGSTYWTDGEDAELITYYESHASVHWHDVVLTVQVSPVPEPATYAMLLGGLGIAGFAARRRKI